MYNLQIGLISPVFPSLGKPEHILKTKTWPVVVEA